ncbi:hypothetical protein V1264_017236 [Littorina saxatilis]
MTYAAPLGNENTTFCKISSEHPDILQIVLSNRLLVSNHKCHLVLDRRAPNANQSDEVLHCFWFPSFANGPPECNPIKDGYRLNKMLPGKGVMIYIPPTSPAQWSYDAQVISGKLKDRVLCHFAQQQHDDGPTIIAVLVPITILGIVVVVACLLWKKGFRLSKIPCCKNS